jgi:ketosteroid isomerase-like protein
MASDSTFDLVTLHTQIKTLVEDNFVAGFKKQDLVAMAQNFAEEGVVMPPNTPALRGQDAASYWSKRFRSGISELKITSHSLTGDSEHLVETGTYELYRKEGLFDKGKYVAVWKPFGDSWKMMYDIWNSDMPLTESEQK